MERKNNILTDQRIVALLAFISCALWGSAFSAVKTGYALLGIRSNAWADQLTFGGIRFAVAGVMALAFGSIRAKKLLLPNRRTFPKICIISLFQTVLQYFCYYIGLANTSGVRASVLVGMNVFTAILISSLLLRIEKLTARSILGCTVGFLGLVLINLDGLQGSFRFLGDGMILLCTVASGFSSAFMKKLSGGEDPVLLSGWQFLLGGLVLAGIGLLGGGTPGHFSDPAVLLLLYLAFISAAAYSLWALLLKYNPVSRVAVYGFMNPVCGVIISAVVLGESGQITLRFVTALLLVCAGIVIVNLTGRHSGA
ncbi:MAG: DMT family transporter [Oscillospiraceae bacterium]|nr:DMT family transporter [Oscillospiraceae bacterium]